MTNLENDFKYFNKTGIEVYKSGKMFKIKVVIQQLLEITFIKMDSQDY